MGAGQSRLSKLEGDIGGLKGEVDDLKKFQATQSDFVNETLEKCLNEISEERKKTERAMQTLIDDRDRDREDRKSDKKERERDRDEREIDKKARDRDREEQRQAVGELKKMFENLIQTEQENRDNDRKERTKEREKLEKERDKDRDEMMKALNEEQRQGNVDIDKFLEAVKRENREEREKDREERAKDQKERDRVLIKGVIRQVSVRSTKKQRKNQKYIMKMKRETAEQLEETQKLMSDIRMAQVEFNNRAKTKDKKDTATEHGSSIFYS